MRKGKRLAESRRGLSEEDEEKTARAKANVRVSFAHRVCSGAVQTSLPLGVAAVA